MNNVAGGIPCRSTTPAETYTRGGTNGYGQFVPDAAETRAGVYVLRQSLEAPYDQPLQQKVTTDSSDGKKIRDHLSASRHRTGRIAADRSRLCAKAAGRGCARGLARVRAGGARSPRQLAPGRRNRCIDLARSRPARCAVRTPART